MKLTTRVMSAWKAMAHRSNNSVACSSKESGMPTGASGAPNRSIRVLLLGLGDAALDFAQVLHVIAQAGFIFIVEVLREVADALRDAVEDAEIVAQAGGAHAGRGPVSAEHAFEQHARIELHRIGRGGRAPARWCSCRRRHSRRRSCRARRNDPRWQSRATERWCPGRSSARSTDRPWCRRGSRCRARGLVPFSHMALLRRVPVLGDQGGAGDNIDAIAHGLERLHDAGVLEAGLIARASTAASGLPSGYR